jgi:glycerophosphoryl diester phosphodiesterase
MPNATKNTSLQLPPNFDVQGHRGCRGLLPENTIPAFKKAIDLGVTTLEMDVVFSKDLKAVVSHEPFFNHEITTKPNGTFVTETEEKSLNIYTINYNEVAKYDVGMKPHPRFTKQEKIKVSKPLLSAVIDSAEAYTKENNLPAIYYNIETKTKAKTDEIFHPKPELFVKLLIQVLQEKNILDRVTIQSFDIRTLQYLHQEYPTIQTAYLFEPPSLESLESRLNKLGFIPTIYSPAYELVNKKMITECHAKNIKVIPWTVNELGKMKSLIALGVDGLITDNPNLLHKKISQ